MGYPYPCTLLELPCTMYPFLSSSSRNSHRMSVSFLFKGYTLQFIVVRAPGSNSIFKSSSLCGGKHSAMVESNTFQWHWYSMGTFFVSLLFPFCLASFTNCWEKVIFHTNKASPFVGFLHTCHACPCTLVTNHWIWLNLTVLILTFPLSS